MKRLILTAALLALTATTADACGPRSQRRAARVEARQTRGQPVRDTVKAVASVPVRVVQARPVATAFTDVVRAFGTCRGGACR